MAARRRTSLRRARHYRSRGRPGHRPRRARSRPAARGCRRRASGNRHDRAAGRPRRRRPRRLALSWIGEDTLEARFPLQKAGLYLGAVQLGTGTVLPLAPLSLPYSPEFEPRPDPEEGKKTLHEIARVTGGAEHDVGRRLQCAPAAESSGKGSRHSARFDAVAPAHDGDRGTPAAVVPGRACG